MRFLRKSLTGLFLFSLTLGLLFWAGALVFGAINERLTREPYKPRSVERVFSVNVISAVPGIETPILGAYGEIESRRTLEIRAASGGRVVELASSFVEGGVVEQGQLLLRVDPADSQAALDRARSDFVDAEAETREAARALDLAGDELIAAQEQADLRQTAWKRQVDLAGRGVGTAAAVENAELAAASARSTVLTRRQALAQAEARVDQARTRLMRAEISMDNAQRHLDDTIVTAGFSGTLSEVSVVEGGLISPNERLARLIDPDALEVAFRISTAQYARLLDQDGRLRAAPVTVTLDGCGSALTAQGAISRDSAAVGEGQTGRLVFAGLKAPRGLKPGDFVSVALEEEPLTGVVRLPSSAMNAASEVLVLNDDERLESIAVDLLRRQGNDILVRSPDLNGREVVAERTPLLGAGIRVKPVRANGTKLPEPPEMVKLSEAQRTKLVEFVKSNPNIPDQARTRILGALERPEVPAEMVERLTARMGG